MMGSVSMAVDAEVWYFFSGQLVSLGSVWCMADHAVFFNWGMGGDERPALVSVAAVAEPVDGFRFNHGFCHRAVGVVTVGAADLAFDDRVMGKLVGFGTNILVTFKALVWLLGVGLGRFVHGVTG